MSGSVQLSFNKHKPTITEESEIPLLALTMSHAETSVFTVVALDRAGNVAVGSPPPLTVDRTPPEIANFRLLFKIQLV